MSCFIYKEWFQFGLKCVLGEPPNITIESEGANLGQTANVTCTATGWPVPRVQFTDMDVDTVCCENDSSVVIGTIENITNSTYVTCNAINEEGNHSETARVKAYSKCKL